MPVWSGTTGYPLALQLQQAARGSWPGVLCPALILKWAPLLCLPILLYLSGWAGRAQRKEDQHGTLPILSGASQERGGILNQANETLPLAQLPP